MIDKQHSTANSDTKPAYPLDVPCLEHIVCIMFENRSFDNMLGYLYGTKDSPVPEDQKFDGLLTGPGHPYSCLGMAGERVEAYPYVAFDDPDPDAKLKDAAQMPFPDPGEEYQHVNVQLYGGYEPLSNEYRHAEEMVEPYNLPKDGVVNMDGFIRNYYFNIYNNNGNDKEKAFELCTQIMGSYTPKQLPVLSTLAKEFAVYDRWFCSVPTQTFPNRAFFHASTSSGIVTNWGNPKHPKIPNPEKWHNDNPALTIFNLLEKNEVSWAIYYDKSQKVSMTTEINSWAFKIEQMPPHEDKIRTMEQFWEDVKNGDLPAYSFVEPRGFTHHNDMHPPLTIDLIGRKLEIPDMSDVRDGEKLLSDVYMAIRASNTPDDGQPNALGTTKSNAMNTTLLITFDEHGGTYDHVVPPEATPPSDLPKETECDCKFDRFGPRVPTIVVSAYTKAGTVINDEMNHSSLIATLCHKYEMGYLGARDKDVPDIGNAFNLNEDSKRNAGDWPETVPNPVADRQLEGPFTGDLALTPLTAPAISYSHLLLARYGEPGEKVPENYGEVYEMLERIGKKIGR
jgi:phospholipase C